MKSFILKIKLGELPAGHPIYKSGWIVGGSIKSGCKFKKKPIESDKSGLKKHDKGENK